MRLLTLVLFLLILCMFGACVAPTGSYSSANAYYPHLEGKGTGQVALNTQLIQRGGTAVAAYALTDHYFVQGLGHFNTYNTISRISRFRPSGQMLLGRYLWRDGYQTISFGLGVGGGISAIINRNESFSEFSYVNTQAQLGISENYGPTRLTLGLNYKTVKLTGGEIYLGGNGGVLQRVEQLKDRSLVHTASGHAAMSWRLNGSLRLHTSYDLTFYAADYNLFDKDCFSLGLMYDLGKMSRPVRAPKPGKKPKKSKSNKKVYDAEGE